MTTHTMEPHLSEAELIDWIDQELSAAAHERANTHIARCTVCAQHLEGLRRTQQQISRLLQETDFEVPAATLPDPQIIDLAAARRRRARTAAKLTRSAWTRAAAVIVLLASATLTIPPLQAAVVTWARDLWTRISGSEQVPTPNVTPGAPQNERGVRVEFTHASSEFRLEFDAADPQSTVTIRRGDTATAVGEADVTGVELVVLPTGLHVRNTNVNAARYVLTVSGNVTTVTVTVGDRLIRRVADSELGAGQTVRFD